jgi:predicted ATPase
MATIKTPDQRLRVFVSSTLQELAPERAAARKAIQTMRLSPILFELGARPHPPQDLYRAYLEQSQIFIGIYWQSYGWVGPGMSISGLQDEFELAAGKPKLLYVKSPAPERQEELTGLLDRIRDDDGASYKEFHGPDELQQLIENDLAIMLTEHFESVPRPSSEDRDASRKPSNLPTRIDTFIGRETELNALTDLLTAETDRFITLTGPGGIGKTRLAIEAARRASETFEDGVCFVPLASVTQSEVVVPTIVQALDIQGSNIDPIVALIGYLRDRHLLLVLDNFEQIVTAAPEIARVAEECPRVTILITSRSLLNVRAERDVEIAPLKLPEQQSSTEKTAGSDAVRLFVERAREIDHDFTLDESNAEVIAEICRRLDGLPLALELAAARTRLLGPEAMLGRLDTSLQLLTGGSRDVPERHQTLRAAIDWSYGLLTEPEKTLFRRMAAFQGGCTLEAAEAVCNYPDDLDLIELMTSLLEKSLIKHDEGGGEPRFSMLRTVWEYARELLEQNEDAHTVRSAHAKFYLELITASYEGLRSSGQVPWLDRLERDHDNLRAALRWCLDHDEAEAVAAAGWTIWLFWWLHSYLAEGRRLMSDALELGGLSEIGRAKALAGKGCMAFWQGDYAVGVPLLTAALETFRAEGDVAGVALCQLPLGFAEAAVGSSEAAWERYKESVRFFKEVGDEWGVAISLNAMCWAALAADLPVEDEEFDDAVARATKLGTELDLGMALRNLGAHRSDQGFTEEARHLLARSIRTLWRGYPRGGTLYAIDAVGEIATKENSPAIATRLFGATDAIRRSTNTSIMPMFAPRLERYLGALRTTLGTDFDREWQHGQELGIQGAVELALAWAEGEINEVATGAATGS